MLVANNKLTLGRHQSAPNGISSRRARAHKEDTTVQGPPVEQRTDSSKRIKGMEGNGYYNAHSRPQGACNELALPVWLDAVKSVLAHNNEGSYLQARIHNLHIADFGSSQGRNSIPMIREALNMIPVHATVVVTHLDLPTNDFNSLIKLTSDPKEGYSRKSKQEVYVSARGGSFYEKVFPYSSVHLAWSAIATHWLSEVPSAPLNHFVVSRATNPEKSYWIEHAKWDWQNFVSNRALELVSGGHFVQVGISTGSDGLTGSEGIWDLLEASLKALWTEERFRSLRLPVYCRTQEEWLLPFVSNPEVWTVRHTSTTKVQNPIWAEYRQTHDLEKFVDSVTGVVRAAYAAGLFRDEEHNLDAFYEHFRAGLRANPQLGEMAWRLTILDAERL